MDIPYHGGVHYHPPTFYHVLTGCKPPHFKILSQTEISKWGTTASSALISSTTFSGG
jgi:hypothetical protein